MRMKRSKKKFYSIFIIFMCSIVVGTLSFIEEKDNKICEFNYQKKNNKLEKAILASTLDGKRLDDFPSLEDGYGIESVDCTNSATGEFRTSNWSFIIGNLSYNNTQCTAHFNTQIPIDNTSALSTATKESLKTEIDNVINEKKQIVNAMESAGMNVNTGDSENPSSLEITSSLNSYAYFKKGQSILLWSLSGGVNSATAALTGKFNGSWTLGSAYTQNGVQTASGLTEKAIDVTDIKTITFNLGFRATGSRTAYVTVGLFDGSNWVSGKYKQQTHTSSGDSTTTKQVVIDVSNLTGTYYLKCNLQDHTYCYARVDSIYMGI